MVVVIPDILYAFRQKKMLNQKFQSCTNNDVCNQYTSSSTLQPINRCCCKRHLYSYATLYTTLEFISEVLSLTFYICIHTLYFRTICFICSQKKLLCIDMKVNPTFSVQLRNYSQNLRSKTTYKFITCIFILFYYDCFFHHMSQQNEHLNKQK